MAQTQRVTGVATKVYDEDGYTKVRYHSTDVVKFNSDKIILDSGGWMTSTTKTRMNQTSNQFHLGYAVYQKGGHWFVRFKGGDIPFHDNMELNR
jgi:hypothetical protein